MPDRIMLTLAHSPDPDDAFMWWPLTGMVSPTGDPLPGPEGKPALDTGRFTFKSLPLDIEALNRRAAAAGDLDITALSVRTWADVQDRYIITSCGASFGDGFGPKLVVPRGSAIDSVGAISASTRIAIPGRRTTAFLMLGLVLRSMGIPAHAGVQSPAPAPADPDKGRDALATFLELPFDQIIPAVARGDAGAGLVIHEGQLTFADAGLRLILDVGQWWKQKSGLKLPLGINAIRRNLDSRHGPGTIAQVAGLLRRSVEYSMSRWDQSVHYTLPFAAANAIRAGAEPPTLDRIDRYCHMYVSEETRDMGDAGRQAIRTLLAEGAAAGLCPAVTALETI